MDPESFGVDYCGPYISGGKFQSSVCSTNTPRTAEEACCKDHDCCYVHAGSSSDFVTCDETFKSCNAPLNSIQSKINSGLVSTFGKYFHSNMNAGDFDKEFPPQKRHRRASYNEFDTSAGQDWPMYDDMCIHDVFTYKDPRPFSVGTTPDRPTMRRVPRAPGRSKQRLRLSSDDRVPITRNLNYEFNAFGDPATMGKRRRFSRLPRFYRRRIANNMKRRWRIAFAQKRRLNWRNNHYARRVSSASRIQRSFRKFLFRKKLRRNSFKRLRFVSSNRRYGRYYKY